MKNNLIKIKYYYHHLKSQKKIIVGEKLYIRSIIKLSKELKNYVNKGDRCLLISENRPEWFISDLSIMLSGSITVPAYTTYAEEIMNI